VRQQPSSAPPLSNGSDAQSWCDLGCDTGAFTIALAQSLASGSTVHAVDLDRRALGAILDQYRGVAILKDLANLRSPGLRLPAVDGILMANSLHFIQEQHLFLRKLLSVTDCFLIVEYDRYKPSPWGPYPVSFERLCHLFGETGVKSVEKLATRRSRFGGTMYSALAEQS
jgi:hypothetical protein